jgi:hypothetical protein
MQDALVFTKNAPVTTLTVDTTVYIGKNSIRRNVGHNTSLYVVGSVTDEYLHIPGNDFVQLNGYFRGTCDESDVFETIDPSRFGADRYIESLVLQVNGPLEAIIDEQLVLNVNKILVLDSSAQSVVLHNPMDCEVTVHVTYALTRPETLRIRISNETPTVIKLGEVPLTGLPVTGMTNIGLPPTQHAYAPVHLTLNRSNQVMTPKIAVTVATDGTWSSLIPEGFLTDPGTYFITVRSGYVADSIRIELLDGD